MKHTQGAVEIRGNQIFVKGTNISICTVHVCHNFDIATGKQVQDIEQKANAQLISEAFNVTNETGKNPAQLAQDNKALIELNKELVEGVRRFVKMLNGSNLAFRRERLDATLNGQQLLTKAERINK